MLTCLNDGPKTAIVCQMNPISLNLPFCSENFIIEMEMKLECHSILKNLVKTNIISTKIFFSVFVCWFHCLLDWFVTSQFAD